MKNEIRFTLELKQRPKLAQENGNILGTASHYERVPSCAYDIAGYRLDKEGVLHIPEGAEETAKDLILQLRERGFQDDAEITEEVPVQQDKLTIAIPKESLTDMALENLQKIIANKQTLFQCAFQTDSTEIEITEEKIFASKFFDRVHVLLSSFLVFNLHMGLFSQVASSQCPQSPLQRFALSQYP